MLSNPFIDRPEFVDLDNRKDRLWNQTSAVNLHKRFSKMLPPDILEGKTVLDLGACIGAAGYWCSYFGATHYTGVEIQEDYYNRMCSLLPVTDTHTLVNMDIMEFFKQNTNKYDIVILSGVLYAFVDYYSVLRGASEIATEYLCIDTIQSTNDKEIEIGVALINSQKDGSFKGLASRFSKQALDFLMASLDFYNTKRDTEVEDYDIYVSNRFITIYKRAEKFYTTIQDKLKFNLNPDKGWERDGI